MSAPPQDLSRGLPAAGLAMVGWAASGVIAKGIDELGPLSVTFWRIWIYAIIVIIFLYARGTPLRLSSFKFSWMGGVALGADIMLFFTALRMTTVANATVIGSCQPIIMLLIAGRLFGERPRRRDWGLAVVALVGVAVVLFGSSGLPEWSPKGDLLSIATVIAWTSYFVFSKRSSEHIDSSQYTGASALVCALFATPFALFSGQLFVMPSANAWTWLVVLAIGPGFASHMLMNWSLGRIPAWLGSTLTLVIPVTSGLLAWLFLGENLVFLQFVGMAIVLGALACLVMGQSHRVSKN
ncbi:MAG: EamA family transporter [Actinobacteria bacterium]|nr:EamA family transporter [Actinomycetota bacterium]